MIGTTISHYKILEKLGGGGMGVVYKAHDTHLDRPVALKFLPPDLTRDPGARERFTHEAKAASSLQHPNICTIHDIDETVDKQLFIVMDYYEGETLQSRIARGQMPINEALGITAQVAQGLAKAHENGIIHRDIKPANIIIGKDGIARIVDFGLAKLAGQSGLTQVGSTPGTAAYMSPEQASGEITDHRTDIWSLGVVLYEMLTGQRAFPGEKPHAVVYSILNKDPKSIEELRPEVPGNVVKVVQKALEKDKEKRFRTAAEVEDILRVQTSGMGGAVPRTSSRSQQLLRALTTSAGVVVAVLVYLYVWPIMEELLSGSERIPLMVMPFENKTGDARYDFLSDAIPSALITSLENSSRLRVTTFERLNDLLKQLGKRELKPDEVFLGLELCRRDSARVLVRGSFTQTGEVFTTVVKIMDAADGRVLKTHSSSGKGTNSLWTSQIDFLSKQIATGVGVPERAVNREEKLVREVTTSSQDAYNLYVRGKREVQKALPRDAVPYFRKAVEIDSTFAMAHFYISNIESDPKRKAESLAKARKYIEKASRKERLWIEAETEPNRMKKIELYRQRVEEYPNDKDALLDLADAVRGFGQGGIQEAIVLANRVLSLDPSNTLAYNILGYTYLITMNEPAKALEVFRKDLTASPGDPNPFDSIAETYFALGILDSAILRYKDAIAVKPEWLVPAAPRLAYCYSLKEDYENAFRWAELYQSESPRRRPSQDAGATYQNRAHRMKSYLYFRLGNFIQAHAEMRRAMALKLASKQVEASTRLEGAFLELNTGHFDQARALLTRYLTLQSQIQSTNAAFDSAWFDLGNAMIGIKLGQIQSAESSVARIGLYKSHESARRFFDTMGIVQNLEAELSLAKGEVDSAIGQWQRQPALSYHPLLFTAYANPSRELANYSSPRDGLARAYAKKGDVDAAIKEYERITTLDTLNQDRRLIDPLHRYELAKLYEKKGLKEKAIGQYERFLFLWRNADRDRPEPKDAKARLTNLKRRK